MKRTACLWLLWAVGCYERLEFDVPKGGAGMSSVGGGGFGGRASGTSTAGARACVKDADCALASLRCDVQSGTCFECVADSDCRARGLSRCDAALHRCVECGIDQDCQSGFICDLTTRVCAQSCVDDEACPAAAHGCDETRLICVECEVDDDDGCALYPARPYCLVPGNRCAECRLSTDCAPGLYCDSITGKCLGCRDSRDCAASQACEPVGHLCVPA